MMCTCEMPCPCQCWQPKFDAIKQSSSNQNVMAHGSHLPSLFACARVDTCENHRPYASIICLLCCFHQSALFSKMLAGKTVRPKLPVAYSETAALTFTTHISPFKASTAIVNFMPCSLLQVLLCLQKSFHAGIVMSFTVGPNSSKTSGAVIAR